jgi:hypothetical protein
MGSTLGSAVLPTNIELSIESPPVVQAGQDFEIRARVRNTAPETQKLVDLAFPQGYLKGVSIQASQPGFSESAPRPEEQLLRYTFNLPIEPGAELELLLHAYAVAPGDYSGELDFTINSQTNSLSHPIHTIVK